MTVRQGLQILTELDRKDSRPSTEQLGLHTNSILENDAKLKTRMFQLVRKYPNLWAFSGNNSSYGETKDMEFHIHLLKEDVKSIRCKYRVLIQNRKSL